MPITNKNQYISKYAITAVIGITNILCYTWIVYNYVNKKICMQSGSYILTSVLYFAACILIMVRLWKPHICTTVTKVWIRATYMLAVPFIAIYMEEWIWNPSLSGLTVSHFIFDYLLLLATTVILILILHRPFAVYMTIMSICWLYGILNYYVLEFKGCPPLCSDFLVADTAVSVIGKYEFWLSDSVILGTGLFFYTMLVLLFFVPCKVCIAEKRKRVFISACGLTGLAMLSIWICNFDIQKALGMDMNSWDPLQSFQRNGAPITLLISMQRMRVDKPENYSDKYAVDLLEQYVPDNGAEEEKTLPTVIAIMNESFSDLGVLGEFESEEFLENWKSLDSYIMRGYTYASVYGGGTCNSEFEFLTGNSMANLDSGMYPYRLLDLEATFNIVDLFRQYGYETIAIHPERGENWNRIQVYKWFGFDDYITKDDMDNIQYLSWQVSDQYNYEQVIQAYENRKGPLFLFNVTMQNHGGYERKMPDNVNILSVERQYSIYEDVANYLTLIRESDKAFAELLEYFRKQEDPVVICMFGDHQPALNEDFFYSLITGDGLEDMERKYMTPYVIWSNFDMQTEAEECDMSINYLAANLLNILGMHADYTDYLLNLEKEIPVINQIGYQTADGIWHSPEVNNDLIEEYQILQYYQLFGRDINDE